METKMNQELARIYGNAPTEDVEKQASANMAEGLAGEGSVDTNGLTEEQIEELAQGVLTGQDVTEKVAGTDTGDTGEAADAGEALTGEEQEKIAEADYLGRIMAHAFVAEQREIFEKTAGKGSAGSKVTKHLKELGARAQKGGKAVGKAVSGAVKKTGKHLKRNREAYAGAAGGVAGGGVMGFAAGRATGGGREVRASATPAIDELALARVQEILEQNGINPEEVARKTAAPVAEAEVAEDPKTVALANAVEQRAIQLLKDQGYTIEEE